MGVMLTLDGPRQVRGRRRAQHKRTPEEQACMDAFAAFLRYDAPGDPSLAARILGLLQARGIEAQSMPEGGLDHGAWTALRYIYPQADIPIVPLAFALATAVALLTQAATFVLVRGEPASATLPEV